ncbi:MBL fold metallo-hydrolase [Terricaulis sp.]|uniref:MBL fold metallo-hydrolase n=1 Tax=Terricaulis sp. TaxID=2768686 RepID=UPI002AC60E82|nr:MBL fold metallo-hydrolase [Terricaulis sp.]MDZ4692841.1 MBL fold metallo-hydrolase [Terricaulis sp.]
MKLTLRSLGGAGTVTGSKHLIDADGTRVLIDCGLFQGLKHLRERNWESLAVPPESIDAVVLTHAHLDHSGYLPKLVREGFRGTAHCTAATADLCNILLKDSAQIAEKDAAYANRKGFSKHTPALPLYTMRDAERALKHLKPIPFGSEFEIARDVGLKFRRAGHILGAATAEIKVGGTTIVFSGDLGRYDDPVMPDPVSVAHADYIVVESTYGDRTHAKTDPMEALGDTIERTVRRGGTVVIPAFAVGRVQSLLHHLWLLKRAGRLAATPIFLDSPMAISATDLLRAHPEDHRLDVEAIEGSCGVASYARDVEASKAITANAMPKVVIAGSGMATGGRVLHHIRTFAPDPRSTILFAGYQALGTRGARLLAGETELKMFGEWIPVRAEIANLPELSAHADADEIMRWLSGFENPPRRLFIVHGEPAASEALRTRVERELSWSASVVDPLRSYELS